MSDNVSKTTALIVDDDPDILLQLKMHLESAGYAVLSADGRKEAEAILKTKAPDIAIIDLMMEEMDGGFMLSHTIKKQFPTMPVIIITAVTRETGIQFDMNADDAKVWVKADVILAKPVRFEQLEREMTRLLGK